VAKCFYNEVSGTGFIEPLQDVFVAFSAGRLPF
jgi:cold shock CspA family protein